MLPSIASSAPRAWIGLLAIATLVAGAQIGGTRRGPRNAPATPVPASSLTLLDEEFLTNPTRTGISISVVPADAAAIRVEYGPAATGLVALTPPQDAVAGHRTTFTLSGLQPSTRYAYRVLTRRPGEDVFGARPVQHFVTLREEDDVFRFAFVTDGHAYQQWANADCGRVPARPYLALQRTLENVLERDVDWMLTTGDEVQTHCVTCDYCTVGGESAGMETVRTLREAELRYQTLVSPELYGRVAKTVPFFFALGNHDGEAGFGNAQGSCYQFDTTAALSRAARLSYLPSPAAAYPTAGPDGSYFAFETGDALFVVLDVFRYTTVYPQTADDWSLGWPQLAWLSERLHASDRKWKFVLAHHLVGGSPDLGANTCYYYGRGGIRSTHDGTPRGFLRGQQAVIHAIMQDAGAQAFLYGHDHIAICGEKQGFFGGGDGVHYIQGGQSGGDFPIWLDDASFGVEMDWNEDGTADYFEQPPRNATMERGFFLVTVRGKQDVTFEYVVTDIEDAAANGRTLFTYVID